MDSGFLGTWALDTSENFEDYMKAIDVSYLTRKAAAFLKPNVILTQNGDSYTLKTESSFKTSETSFKLGQEYDETTADGRVCQTTFSFENGKLVQNQKGKIPSTITRELKDPNTLVTTCEAKGVTCVRTYTKVVS